MKEKTIEQLNGKMWFRFLKSAYLIILIIIILITNLAIILDLDVKKIDENKTVISCLGGNKEVLSPKQIGIYLNSSDFKEGFSYKKFYEGYGNEYAIRDIWRSCSPDGVAPSDILIAQRIYEIMGTKENRKKYDESYLEEQVKSMSTGYKTRDQKLNYLDYSVKIFEIKPVFSYKEFLLYFVGANIFILVLFEVVRRVFYYIVLGKIYPKKKNESDNLG